MSTNTIVKTKISKMFEKKRTKVEKWFPKVRVRINRKAIKSELDSHSHENFKIKQFHTNFATKT